MVKVEWEDIPVGPNGDFNDMMFFLQGRDSTENSGFPIMSLPSGDGSGLGCRDLCGQFADCSLVTHLTANEVAFSVMVAVDSSSSENFLEAPGRLIHVTVATYGAPGVAGTEMVVCPALLINRPSVAPNAIPVGYGINPIGQSPSCDPQPQSGTPPICAPSIPQAFAQNHYFALSRDQQYQANCAAARTGPGDVFEFQPVRSVAQSNGSNCDLAMPHIEVYEIELDKLAGLLDPSLSTVSDADLLNAIQGVELFMIHEPNTTDPFYCPSGLGHEIDTVEVTIGTLQNTIIVDPSFRYEESRR